MLNTFVMVTESRQTTNHPEEPPTTTSLHHAISGILHSHGVVTGVPLYRHHTVSGALSAQHEVNFLPPPA